jgi:hypothetical protein
MRLRRVAPATTFAFLILAAPAAASTAVAGPSPTPLILELVLAAVVITGMAVRRPLSRAFGTIRRAIVAPRARSAGPRVRF